MTTSADKHETLMARIDISPEDWAAVRVLAIQQGVTTQKLIGDTLRERLEREAAK